MEKQFSPYQSDTPIFIKTYELYKLFYLYLPTFPKKDRYTLGQKCELALLDILENIIVVGYLSKLEKLPLLRKISIKLDVLKVLFRLGKDIKVIDHKKYLEFENYFMEIGRMIGGWIKSVS